MKLENQVVSLELAQKMKELGFEQWSFFDWRLSDGGLYYAGSGFPTNNQISAYTTSELGDMLPVDSRIQKGDMDNGEPADWYCSVNWKETSLREPKFEGDEVHTECGYTLADAMAKMLIYLKENDLLK